MVGGALASNYYYGSPYYGPGYYDDSYAYMTTTLRLPSRPRRVAMRRIARSAIAPMIRHREPISALTASGIRARSFRHIAKAAGGGAFVCFVAASSAIRGPAHMSAI